MHFLFGTATEDEVEDVREVVRDLASNQGRLIHQLNHFTTIINHTFDEIQANRNRINTITRQLNTMVRDINDKLQNLAACLHRLTMVAG
jgi:ABC-type transporter Mla subunit MlaD